MKVRAAVATDVGRARERNEDAYLLDDPLFAVADGMGGHRGGNVASTLAVEVLGQAAKVADRSRATLMQEFREANRRVLETGTEDPALHGMGTTLTAVRVVGAGALIAHVGDSRAYLLRDGELHLLTEDHTLVQRMVREGKLSREGARHHPQRSILTRALGVEDDLPVDEVTLPLRGGDRLLLCTDGLTGMLSEDSIRDILLGESESQNACEKLVDEANRAGGDDNITVVVMDFEAEEAALDPPAEPATAPPTTSAGATSPRLRAPFPWIRVALWAGGLGAVLLVAVLGLRVYTDHQWYVGDAGGQVAIYNGIPTKIVGFRLSHVQEVTDLPADQAERLLPWSGLESGITARSFQDAQAIVDQIRRDLQLISGAIQSGGGG